MTVTQLCPKFTPFPYTTLFRSRERRGGLPLGADVLRSIRERHRQDRLRSAYGLRCPHDRPAGTGRVGAARAGRQADRKSTRLNSSHPSISYAVFCLKKKNKEEC